MFFFQHFTSIFLPAKFEHTAQEIHLLTVFLSLANITCTNIIACTLIYTADTDNDDTLFVSMPGIGLQLDSWNQMNKEHFIGVSFIAGKKTQETNTSKIQNHFIKLLYVELYIIKLAFWVHIYLCIYIAHNLTYATHSLSSHILYNDLFPVLQCIHAKSQVCDV